MYTDDQGPVERFAHSHSIERMAELDLAAIGIGAASRTRPWLRKLFIGVVVTCALILVACAVVSEVLYGRL